MSRPENLTEIRDRASAQQLCTLLNDAIADLRVLGAEPVVVAACPAKFNDASNDQDWEAIRVGAFFSERTSYFAPPSEHEKNLAAGPEAARKAAATLARLQKAGWRERYKEAFDRPNLSHEEVIALVLQAGKVWFVVDGSNSGESAAYALTADKGLRHLGHVPSDADGHRFDQRLDRDPPLLIRTNDENRAGRAAIVTRLAELEAKPAGERPDWMRWGWRIKRAGAPPTPIERLEQAAWTGRISKEEYNAIRAAIWLNRAE